MYRGDRQVSRSSTICFQPHSAPADFSLGSKPFAVAFGNGAGLAKRLRDSTRVLARIFSPCGWTRSGINTHNAILADAKLPKLLADLAGLSNVIEKTTALLGCPRVGTTANSGPQVWNQRSGNKFVHGQFVGEAPQVFVCRINIGVGQRQEQVDPVEPCPIHLRCRCEAKHGVEVDRRL